MAVMTTLERLEEVQLTITRILSGAEAYSIGNRSVTEARLDTLITYERRLKNDLAREEAIAARGNTLGLKKIIPGFRG